MASSSKEKEKEGGELEEEDDVMVINVWKENMDHEVEEITQIVREFNFVAFDTEFPGTIIKSPNSDILLPYSVLRENVNRTKLIQLGFTLGDQDGNLPKDENQKKKVWQFNFSDFDLTTDDDEFDPDSIELLIKSGLDLELFKTRGIPLCGSIGEKLLASGVFNNKRNCLVSFQGSSDMGYLIKLFTQQDLPQTYQEFMILVARYFPYSIDVKLLSNVFMQGNTKGLDIVSNRLRLKRKGGISHQGGSDSYLTYIVFLKLLEKYGDEIKNSHYNTLYGLTDT
ncbi:probable CCR4-associated factor 1 homolog 6 [Impatiens glandulifera]|uniref:probable CCR4-associated factor 1 homolog 6 n=1 Tax=Impatiens glandulifera TaxID=253017 RepID=UPI001FB0DA10|nr:probable CCR4-associated factor 1 homolog 6 [Impatiens glandulifera]